MTGTKWSLCSIPNEGKFLKGIIFHPVSSRPTFRRLVGSREVTEFEIVISGKIMGNPWEPRWSHETMQLVPLMSTFSENVLFPLSFQLSSKAVEQKGDTIIRHLPRNKISGTTVQKALVFYLRGNQRWHRHLLISSVKIHPEQLQQRWTATGHLRLSLDDAFF